MDDSEYGPGKKGIYASFTLVVVTVLLSLLFEHYFSSDINLSSWTDYCDSEYESSCLGNSAVYRFSFALSIFFITQMLGSFLVTSYFDNYWILKVLAYGLLIFAFFFSPVNHHHLFVQTIAIPNTIYSRHHSVVSGRYVRHQGLRLVRSIRSGILYCPAAGDSLGRGLLVEREVG